MILLLIFLAGCMVGSTLSRRQNKVQQHSSLRNHGFVVQLRDVPATPTSHTDQKGLPIIKQQLIAPFSVVDNLAGISIATLLQHQRIERHAHGSMHEFFFVTIGQGTIQVGARDTLATVGTFVHVAPGEEHALWTDHEDGMTMMVVGLTTDRQK
jgi:mannose-6-phosphate isomerase-like protein (cupin superfamily)